MVIVRAEASRIMKNEMDGIWRGHRTYNTDYAGACRHCSLGPYFIREQGLGAFYLLDIEVI